MGDFPLRQIRNKSMEAARTSMLNTDQRGTKRSTFDKMFREQNITKKPARIKVMEALPRVESITSLVSPSSSKISLT
jgi:hypothetical protein